MWTAVGALVGIIVGWALKAGTDWVTERRNNTRADRVWRREKQVDAAASLAHAARQLCGSDLRLGRAIASSSNARQGRNQAIIESCIAEEQAAAAEQAPWTTAALAALAQVRVYGSDDLVKAADAVWEALHFGGHLPGPLEMGNFENDVYSAIDALVKVAREQVGN